MAHAYIEAPFTLGRLITDASNIVELQVEKLDRDRGVIIYRKLRDLKGTHAGETIRHNVGGRNPQETALLLRGLQPGSIVIKFYNGGASETCVDRYWYQTCKGEADWWNFNHGEPYLLRSYAGTPTRLTGLVTAILAGQEVAAPCFADGDKPALARAEGRLQRLRASLKLTEYDEKRDFIGWGGDAFRPVTGLPGFNQISNLTRVDPFATGIALADANGDGRPDVCLFGETKTALLVSDGNSLAEAPLPYAAGARAAAWADYNGDGKPDLLLATPTGLRLLANTNGVFRDESACLPREPYPATTAAAWLDADGDKRPDILCATSFAGLRLYRQLPRTLTAPAAVPQFGPWHYAGPFDNTDNKGFATAYPPEQIVNLAARYAGKHDLKFGWQPGKFTDGQVNDLTLFGEGSNDNVAVYLYREVRVAQPIEWHVSLGSDDTITFWLNGKRLLAEETYRGCAPDQHKLAIPFVAGVNRILIKICNGGGGFAFYFAASEPPPPTPLRFADVSAQVGLGPDGLAGRRKGAHLTIADVNGDGRPDFLYAGILALHQGDRFVASPDTFPTGPAAFGDYDGDGRPDLFVAGKLYHNEGAGRFREANTLGDLPGVTSAAWGDFFGRGAVDLLVSCWRSPNRLFRNLGGGKFAEEPFHHRIYNSRAVALADLNQDGVLDLVLNNEGQDPLALLGAPGRK